MGWVFGSDADEPQGLSWLPGWVSGGGTARTLRTTQWTRASSTESSDLVVKDDLKDH